MDQRRITADQVAQTLRDHVTSYEDTRQGSKCFEGDIEGRILKVWIVWPITSAGGIATVKSAAWK